MMKYTIKKIGITLIIIIYPTFVFGALELNNRGLEKGKVTGLKVKYESCSVYQGTKKLEGSVIYCNKVDNLTVIYPSEKCNTISNYQMLSGESYLTQFRFACEQYIEAGISASVLSKVK